MRGGLALPLCWLGVSPALHAQTETGLQRQLKRLDLGLNGIGLFNSNSSGTNYANSNPTPAQAQPLTLTPGNTLGALVTIRYTKSPWLGAEFNYTYARYTQKFSGTTAPLQEFDVQNNVDEYSLGYVAHIPREFAFGLRPFASAGLGATEFKPTTFGGQSLRPQARMTYFFAAGADAPVFSEHFALRLQYRQAFFLAPDYGQNYLTIKQRTTSIEPAFGFVFKF